MSVISIPSTNTPPVIQKPRQEANQQPLPEVAASEDDVPLSALLAQHTESFTGNGTPIIPVSVPIMAQVRPALCQQIWANKYVDLGFLLPSFSPPPQQSYTLQVDNRSNLSWSPAARPAKITCIEEWTSAFIRYMAVYADKYPTEVAAMLKYAEIGRDIAAKRKGVSFLEYDTQFRMSRESRPLPWDQIHMEFFLLTFPSNPTEAQPRSNRLFRASASQQPSKVRFLLNTCFLFNKKFGCRSRKCKRPNVCGFCRGPHTAYACAYTSIEHAARSMASKSTVTTSMPNTRSK